MPPLEPLINFFKNPLFILTVIYLLSLLLVHKFGKKIGPPAEAREFRLIIEALFLLFGFDIWISILPYSWNELPPAMLFLVIITITSELSIWRKGKIVLVGGLISVVLGIVFSLLLQPMYKGDFPIFLILSNTTVSGFFYMTSIFSLISFLAGFLGLSYIHFLLSIFKKKHEGAFPPRQSIIAHIQFIFLFLLPLLFVQIIGSSNLLEPLTLTLYSATISLVFLPPCCAILSLLGDRIFKIKFLWGASILSMIAFFNTIYVAFQFVALNSYVGPFALSIIMSSLLSCSIGTILARHFSCPESIVFHEVLQDLLHRSKKHVS